MSRLLLNKERLTLRELLNRWEQETYDDFVHIIENSALDVYVRPLALRAALPPDYVEKLQQCPLDPTKVYRLIQEEHENVEIKDFVSPKIPTKTNIAFEIRLGDVVVLLTDIKNLEREYCESLSEMIEILTPDYRNIKVGDKEYSFGEKQAAIIKYLYERMQAGEPWVNGKTLMKIADAAGVKVHGLFSRNSFWREMVKSDSRGRYRLNP